MKPQQENRLVECSRNVMAHSEARGKWRRNRRMNWVASARQTAAEHRLSRITTNNKDIRNAA